MEGRIFYRENFLFGGKFLGVSFQKEILHVGYFPEFVHKTCFMSFFLFSNSILHVEIFWGEFSVGLEFSEAFSMGEILYEEIFHGRNFPLEEGGQKYFPHRGISSMD